MEWEVAASHSGLIKQHLQPGSFYKGWVAFRPWVYIYIRLDRNLDF